MKVASPIVCEMRTDIPAALDAVEEFLSEVRRNAQENLDPALCFAAELLAREALTNAVVHGCGGNPEKRVHCVLRLRDKRLTISIRDEGEGFDWRAVKEWQSGSAASSGRGLEILRKFSGRIRYNEKGNAVTIIKEC